MKMGNHCRSLAILSITFLVTACAVAPQTRQSLAVYTAAMQQVEDATDKFLVDFASAEDLRADIEESLLGESPNSYPTSFDPLMQSDVSAGTVRDDIQERRKALAIVSAYNDALVALAEGQPETVVRSRLEAFGGGVESVLGTVGATLGSGFAAVIPAASQLATMIQDGLNAQQFAEAIELGQPIVKAILSQLESDTEQYYSASITVTERERDPIADQMEVAMELVLDLVAQHSEPADVELKNKVRGLERRIRSANIRTKTLVLVPNELPFDASKPEINENALKKINSAVLAVESIEAKDSEIVAKQNAYYELMGAYVRTLRQTKASLAAVKDSLNEPRNFDLLANELLDSALSLRDAFAEYKAAR